MGDWAMIGMLGCSWALWAWSVLPPNISGKRLAASALILASGGGMLTFMAYAQGQKSVRQQAYVQHYPSNAGGWGPYMGECLRRPEGTFCPQERD